MSIEELPTTITLIGTIMFCMIVEDSVFYFAHRLLHTPFLYRHIHSLHHEYKTTVGIAAEYTHPIEYLLGVIIPSVIGPLILGP